VADRDPGRVSADVDWREVARLVLTSREMDRIEEQELVPAKKMFYQFSARGHDMAQVLLGMQLKDGDGAFGYYRSRPLLLALGVPLADALGSGMGLAGGYSDGRDIGVVFNYPNPGGAVDILARDATIAAAALDARRVDSVLEARPAN
jgi:2-oxoisovalerate dehydrogenase E1 component